MCGKYRQKIADYLKLYLILETEMLQIPLEEFIQQVTEGGVTAIQLRDKKLTAIKRYENGVRIKELLRNKDVMLSVNDRLDLAIVLNIDVVHVGVKDIPPSTVKKYCPDFLVGYSCNTYKDIKTAEESNVDYIGIGPFAETPTKEDLRDLLGREGIGRLASHTYIPAVAIGGITLGNCVNLIDTNIKGIAVSSEICKSKNPYLIAKKFREFFP
jgi:thiamine-phosphate pyrophosphorylase